MTSQEELLAAFALRAIAERYAMAVDEGDGELFAAQFTPDGVLEAPKGVFTGRGEIATVPPMMKRFYDRTHHGVVGMTSTFSGDNATAKTYTHARHYYRDDAGVEQCYEMTIRYDDRFYRLEGQWLLSQRVLVLIGDATYPTGRRRRSGAEAPKQAEPRI